jgi:hypothetical protein
MLTNILTYEKKEKLFYTLNEILFKMFTASFYTE